MSRRIYEMTRWKNGTAAGPFEKLPYWIIDTRKIQWFKNFCFYDAAFIGQPFSVACVF